MSKITLNNVGNLVDATTSAITINTNNAVIQSAMDNTLSRNGQTPNTMQAPIDMNSNQIINLPTPATNNSPLRLQDLETFNGGGTITNIPVGGTTGQVLGKQSNTDYDIAWQTKVISVGLSAPADFAITGSPVTSSGTLGLSYVSPPTGTGVFVKQNSPTLTGHPTLEGITSTGATGTGKLVFDTSPTVSSPQVTGPLNVTTNSAIGLTVGAGGTTNSVLTIDGSTASQASGLRIKGAISGGQVAIDLTDPGASTGLTINSKGAGAVTIGNVSTGGVNLGSATTVTSNSVTSLNVGPNGTTNPVFGVDSSVASSQAGLRVSGAATGGTVKILTTDPGSNNNLSINAAGTGTVSIANTSTGNVTVGNVTLTRPASTATLTLGSGKTAAISNTLTFTGTDGMTVPYGTRTRQTFLSGSGTYTTPSNVKYLLVRMIGGGGGGAGSGTTPGNGGAGGNTTFGSSFLTAIGGNGATASAGGTGSTPTGGDLNFVGATGQNGSGVNNTAGGNGGISFFGGAGWGGSPGAGAGVAATANSGSGGGGGGVNLTPNGGGGGGAGGYLEKIVTAPNATYAYAIGAAGTAGTTGTSGAAGAAGAVGLLIVDEFYT